MRLRGKGSTTRWHDEYHYSVTARRRANRSGQFQGSSDLPLVDLDCLHALRPIVASLNCDAFYTSPLRRARQSAEAVGVEGEELDLLRECDMGAWELLTWDEISTQFTEMIDTWASDYMSFEFPDGETVQGFCARIVELAHFFDAHTADHVFAVTHGGVIRHLICHYLGLPWDKYLLFAPRNATITTLDIDGGRGVLRTLGESR